ncbi:NAD(P)H-dependent oxidoreductase [Mucilaginibacter sp. CSA2-8R]|uniref:NAD(P)H-dependent oxidoreductase n=1 Tax=Mucilaginibacter sp. CSA2-8R TaxID=3141542 RepID=UPI00315C84D1
MSLQQSLAWRYATKKFDSSKKIDAATLDNLLQTVKLAPSSYGLQHYELVVVEDTAVRERLKEAAYGQSQLTDASQVIVFAAETKIDEDYVKRYMDEVAAERHVDREKVADFEKTILGAISRQSDEQRLNWSHKQAYLALGVLIGAASELSIDTCPMEGFNAAKFDEILGLKEKGLTSSVIVTIGYRAADDPYSKMTKVRKKDEDFFIKI